MVASRPPPITHTSDTRYATTSMKRSELAQWLIAQKAKDLSGTLYNLNVLLDKDTLSPIGKKQKGFSKLQLFDLCRERDPKPQYEVQKWFDDYNQLNPGRHLALLILPVATPQLNPIENMWCGQKQHVRKWNFKYTMAEIQRLAMEKYHSQTAEDWEKQFNKMLRFANDQ